MSKCIIATEQTNFNRNFGAHGVFFVKNQCKLNYYDCPFCDNEFCTEHGQAQRIEAKNTVNLEDISWKTLESSTLKFCYIYDPDEVRTVRKKFFSELRKIQPNLQYVWRLHWEDYIPHFHMISIAILCDYSDHVKDCWARALESINHPHPTTTRSQSEPTDDPPAQLNYDFQCNKHLRKFECPPEFKGKRWHIWDSTKLFKY